MIQASNTWWIAQQWENTSRALRNAVFSRLEQKHQVKFFPGQTLSVTWIKSTCVVMSLNLDNKHLFFFEKANPSTD